MLLRRVIFISIFCLAHLIIEVESSVPSQRRDDFTIHPSLIPLGKWLRRYIDVSPTNRKTSGTSTNNTHTL
ncbi:unnamed protein product [Auanema sp. JU1783]|nr:unnamed protein product [Auanema sp. JU1783]